MVKLDMLVRLTEAISMLSFVPNTFYFMIKLKSAKFVVVEYIGRVYRSGIWTQFSLMCIHKPNDSKIHSELL